MFHLYKDETFKYVFVTVMTTFKETIEYIDLTRAKSDASVHVFTSNNKSKNYFKLVNLKP